MQNGKYGIKLNIMNKIVYESLKQTAENLRDLLLYFENKKILITGYKGFLGANFCAFFKLLNDEYLKNKVSLYCIDSEIINLENITADYVRDFNLFKGDSINFLPSKDYNYVIHCAGIASPTYYRKYPLETIKVNAIDYFSMLEQMNCKQLEGFLYFSTSEIYGDPDLLNIPTEESYRGNVSCTGPRACYDESKRLGETISISYYLQKSLPIKIVRPFNVYGIFMRLNDRRVIPDFVKGAIENRKITIYSDGSPTRAFCYVSDALEGFIRALLIGKPAKPYNIGNDSKETSMAELAEMISMKTGNVKIEYKMSDEKNYLTDNPNRRCPVLKRAFEDLNYIPKIDLDSGLDKTINWYNQIYLNR